ncbi:hypothetical protein [Brachybacterium kimchii]|uniref:DUF4259 domain-containing protein n=1 Tax=Brachybacterium kimchii TaxID=2942909 RepID=A0ABY4NC99_9MICO|nr:hypothetical protein [Brachybacterium kimchii]UQN31794.1 hypothetical protein M4486_19585 [Brachybacterium kimchii]
MTLNIHDATSLDELAAQCDARTTGHLARLMLRTFAELGAAEEWTDLPTVAEDIAASAGRLGLPVGDTTPREVALWREIADTTATPPRPLVGADALTVNAAALALSDTWGNGLAADLAGSITCEEADALLALFDAVGAHQTAQEWREFHAESDEEGDKHYLPLS